MEDSYGIIPHRVLTDKTISATSKLVLTLITSLSAKEGYCWANNKYLAEQLGISERQISRSITELHKYIKITGGQNQYRKICLDKNVLAPRQKRLSGLDKNVYHNNIKNNINKNTASNEIERRYGFRPSVLPNFIIERG